MRTALWLALGLALLLVAEGAEANPALSGQAFKEKLQKAIESQQKGCAGRPDAADHVPCLMVARSWPWAAWRPCRLRL